MLFNSLEFALFLPLVFLLYWFVFNRNLRLQNLFIVGISYLFYGWWDWRFLLLIAFTSGCSYLSGRAIARYGENRKTARRITGANIALNLGILFLFKYFNFFASGFSEMAATLGFQVSPVTLRLILPVGISFYTFQALSYTIDIYKGKIKPSKDPVAFFAFVSFFPQLVAGPIERSTQLLPQFARKRDFSYEEAADGTRQILWGLFKKMVIADNCAVAVNQIFDNYGQYGGSTLLVGGILFAFQIYGDFSGYSDMALGISRLFGFSLMRNFNYPYFSRDIAEFWRRWHISLSTWFRDYLYIPLGGSRGSRLQSIRNVMIIFMVSGLWHGANLTFICWGAFHGLLFLPLLLSGKNRTYTDIPGRNRMLPSLREGTGMALTFLLVVMGWIFFRSATITDAIAYIGGIFSRTLFEYPAVISRKTAFFILLLITVEWIQRDKQHALQLGRKHPAAIRWSLYYGLAIIILLWGGIPESFIYFQF